MIFVTHLESTGTQYIDTGICPTQNTRILLDAEVSTTGLAALFGARGSYRNSAFAVFSSGSYLQDDYGTDSGNAAVSGTGRHLFDKKQNVLSVDGTVVRTSAADTFACPYPMALLSINNGGRCMTDYPVSAKLYSAKIYDGDTLLQDLLPALDNDGVPGLYDKVSGGFYRNAGTGSFRTGGEVDIAYTARFTVPAAGEYHARVYAVNPQGAMQSELTQNSLAALE